MLKVCKVLRNNPVSTILVLSDNGKRYERFTERNLVKWYGRDNLLLTSVKQRELEYKFQREVVCSK